MAAPEVLLPDLLRSLRKAAGLTQAALAERLCTGTGTWTLTRHEISRWERGQVRPDAWMPAIADSLNVDVEALRRAPQHHVVVPQYADAAVEAEWVSEVLRRTFLKRGITAGAFPAVDNGQLNRVIQALDLVAHAEDDQLGAFTESVAALVSHYALVICALPPVSVYDELLMVRSYTGDMLGRARSTERCRTDLIVSTGWLSNLLAIAASDMGEHAAARVWCTDAERRSEEAGKPELSAWATLTRAMSAFYHSQPRESVLLAARGQDVAPLGSVIHAKLAAQEMRAAAMIGDADRMSRSRRHASQAISALPYDAATTGAFSIALGEDPPYTATSLCLVGEYQEAVSATERVIRTVYRPEARQRGEHPSGYARALLILGLANAGVGRVDDAAAAGHEALAGSRPAWPTMVLAGQLDRVLTRDFSDAQDAASYHARYLEAATSSTALRPALPRPREEHR